MKLWIAVLAISGLVTVQANIFDQISAVANNVVDAYNTGSVRLSALHSCYCTLIKLIPNLFSLDSDSDNK